MRLICTMLLAVALDAFSPNAACACEPGLAEAAPRLLEAGSVNGAAIAVVRPGGTVLCGFGDRGCGGVDADTVFEAASLTKPVVALAVCRMSARGELDLDAPLGAGDWTVSPPDAPAAVVTARMILSHTSGIEGVNGNLVRFAGQPGERFQYAGDAYLILQRHLEERTGMPLQAVVQREVFAPLGMARSSLVWNADFEPNFAVGHRSDGSPLAKWRPEAAHAGVTLHTTVRDMAVFISALASGAAGGDKAVSEMIRPVAPVAEGVMWGSGIGLAADARGHRLAWQWGDYAGHRAFLTVDLDASVGVVVLTNSENGMSIVRDILTTVGAGAHPGLAWLDYPSIPEP